MPKQALVTAEIVFSAADALVAEGKQPSQRSVREFIGGGSLSTIGPILRSWRQNRGLNPSKSMTSEDISSALPPNVAARVSALHHAAEALIVAMGKDPEQSSTTNTEKAADATHHQPAPPDNLTADSHTQERVLREEIVQLRNLAEQEILRLREERDGLRRALDTSIAETEQLRGQLAQFRDHIETLTMRLSEQ